MTDRAWFVRLYGEIIPSFSGGIIDLTGAQTMLYLTCTMTSNQDLALYGVSRAKDWVSVDCGVNRKKPHRPAASASRRSPYPIVNQYKKNVLTSKLSKHFSNPIMPSVYTAYTRICIMTTKKNHVKLNLRIPTGGDCQEYKSYFP